MPSHTQYVYFLLRYAKHGILSLSLSSPLSLSLLSLSLLSLSSPLRDGLDVKTALEERERGEREKRSVLVSPTNLDENKILRKQQHPPSL